jgi:hypothetical protein
MERKPPLTLPKEGDMQRLKRRLVRKRERNLSEDLECVDLWLLNYVCIIICLEQLKNFGIIVGSLHNTC